MSEYIADVKTEFVFVTCLDSIASSISAFQHLYSHWCTSIYIYRVAIFFVIFFCNVYCSNLIFLNSLTSAALDILCYVEIYISILTFASQNMNVSLP
jgi:hypothetical protein